MAVQVNGYMPVIDDKVFSNGPIVECCKAINGPITSSDKTLQNTSPSITGYDEADDEQHAKRVNALIRSRNVEFVRIEICDMYGISRCRIVPARHFPRIMTLGKVFPYSIFAWDPVCSGIEGSGLQEDVGYCDMVIRPDLQTFGLVPWLPNTARVLVDSTFRGKPVSQEPRQIARIQLEKLKGMGFSLLSAHEYEFYVKEQSGKMISDLDGESHTTVASLHSNLVYKLIRELAGVGVDVETFHMEEGAGQMEITYKPSFGLKAADVAFTFKTSVKEICQSLGYTASFMSKPYLNGLGSSCHFNHSLWDAKGKESMFFDKDAKWNLSEVGQHWIAGLVTHAPSIALLCAPTINCIKRFQPGSFAPVNATWGIDNRTAAIRYKFGVANDGYVENRIGASASNPYLLLAATVAAGMDGMNRKLTLGEPVTKSAYKTVVPGNAKALPTTMADALGYFVADDLMLETFGTDFIQTFVALKKHEIKKEMEAMGNGKGKTWEYDFFFEIL